VDKVKLGVVGTGIMGQNHARICSELQDIKFSGVCDLDKAVGRRVAKRCGTNFYSSFNKMLKDVDAVTIATPTVTHFKLATQALEAGKHVLVEKPICADISSAQKLCDTASQLGLVLSVGHVERHNPVVEYAKCELDRGSYGNIISMSGRRVGGAASDRVHDVGVVFDLGIHEIDICRYLAGSEVEKVGAFGGAHRHKLEDFVTLMLDFANGICASIEINWLTPLKIRKLGLTCSKAHAEIDYLTQKVQISSGSIRDYDVSDMSYLPWVYDIRTIPLKKQEPLKRELRDFVDAVNRVHAPLVTGEDGLAAVRIAEAAIKSYKEKRIIDVREL